MAVTYADHRGNTTPSAVKRVNREVTSHRLARARQLPLAERLKAAATVVAEGQPIRPNKQLVAGLFGVSVTGIEKTLNGSRRRRPQIGPKTLAALCDLYQEVFFLAGIKYRDAQYQREQLNAFAAYFAKWLTAHPEVQQLGGIGPAPALHAISINALWALVDAIVAN